MASALLWAANPLEFSKANIYHFWHVHFTGMDASSFSGEDAEGPRAKRYKQMRKQDILEEALEQGRKLEDQEARLQKQERLLEKLKGMVECPVCLTLPVEGPVPC